MSNLFFAKKGLYKVGDVVERNGEKEILKKLSGVLTYINFDIWETKEISKLEYEMRKIIEENKK